MSGFERESAYDCDRDCTSESDWGTRVDRRDTVVRTVVFALASFTAWWCWSSGASASVEQAEPAEPVLFPVVVQPLVEAATPAVAPTGNSVLPVVDAVTTPAAPVLHSVVPVADQIVGPVVAPAAGPAVEVVEPVVEQVATSVAPVVGQAAPAVAPFVAPVTGAMAPTVREVMTSVTHPVADVAQPALRSVLSGGPRDVGLRPSTAVVPIDRWAAAPVVVPAAVPAPAPVPDAGPSGEAIRSRAAGTDGADVDSVSTAAAAVPPASAPEPAHPGLPFRAALPPAATGTVMGSQGGSDGGQRSPRPLAVLPSAEGPSAPQVVAVGGDPVDGALARFGGRAPVTPD